MHVDEKRIGHKATIPSREVLTGIPVMRGSTYGGKNTNFQPGFDPHICHLLGLTKLASESYYQD